MVLMALAKAHNQRVELESRLLSGLNKGRKSRTKGASWKTKLFGNLGTDVGWR